MPKLKESLGTVRFRTPFLDEFQRYLCYELENSKKWNPNIMTGGMVGMRKWKYECSVVNNVLWSISYDGKDIQVTSDAAEVHIRKGLKFRMGHGDFVLEGYTP